MTVALSIFVSLGLSGCNTSSPVSQKVNPNQNSISSNRQGVLNDIDFVDREILNKIPNFAGVYLDKEGVYKIAIAGTQFTSQSAELGEYETLIRGAYNLGSAAPKDKLGQLATAEVKTEFVHVKYNLKQLATFRKSLEKFALQFGISGLSLNYEANKVVVFYSSGKNSIDIGTLLRTLGVPDDAIEIWGALKSEWSASATDYVRPFGGAVQFTYSSGGSTYECSVGPLAKRVLGSTTTYGFLTARHCGYANAAIYQGNSQVGNVTVQAPVIGGGVDSEVEFVATGSSVLRQSQFAAMNYGYNHIGQYSSWTTSSTIPSSAVSGSYTYSYGIRGQVPGQVKFTGLTLTSLNPAPKNQTCSEIISSNPTTVYNDFLGQSGGVVTGPNNSIVGILSNRSVATNPSTNQTLYLYCFSPIQNALQALSSQGSFSLY